MNGKRWPRVLVGAGLTVALTLSPIFSAYALPFFNGNKAPEWESFSLHGVVGEAVCFDAEDFLSHGTETEFLMLTTLPDSTAATLQLGTVLLQVGDRLDVDALPDLVFYPLDGSTEYTFSFIPVRNEQEGAEFTVTVILTEEENLPPEASAISLVTCRNVAVNGQCQATDPEEDAITFRLVDSAARGSVELKEDGSFVYAPYRGKTGKDSFSYVAVDSAGNTSAPATVQVVIEKLR